MGIKGVSDVLVPLGVWGADYGTDYLDRTAADPAAFKWNRPVGIAVATIGYVVGGWLGYGGVALKNAGIASLDWGLTAIVDYIKEASGTPATSRVARRAGTVSGGRLAGHPQQPRNGEGLWPRAI